MRPITQNDFNNVRATLQISKYLGTNKINKESMENFINEQVENINILIHEDYNKENISGIEKLQEYVNNTLNEIFEQIDSYKEFLNRYESNVNTCLAMAFAILIQSPQLNLAAADQARLLRDFRYLNIQAKIHYINTNQGIVEYQKNNKDSIESQNIKNATVAYGIFIGAKKIIEECYSNSHKMITDINTTYNVILKLILDNLKAIEKLDNESQVTNLKEITEEEKQPEKVEKSGEKKKKNKKKKKKKASEQVEDKEIVSEDINKDSINTEESQESDIQQNAILTQKLSSEGTDQTTGSSSAEEAENIIDDKAEDVVDEKVDHKEAKKNLQQQNNYYFRKALQSIAKKSLQSDEIVKSDPLLFESFSYCNKAFNVKITQQVSQTLNEETKLQAAFAAAIKNGFVTPQRKVGVKLLHNNGKAIINTHNKVKYQLCEVKLLGESQNGHYVIGDMRLLCLWDHNTNIIHGFEITNHKGVEACVDNFNTRAINLIEKHILQTVVQTDEEEKVQSGKGWGNFTKQHNQQNSFGMSGRK